MIGLVIFLFLSGALLLLGLLAQLYGLAIFAGLMVIAMINSIDIKLGTEHAQIDAKYDRLCNQPDAFSQAEREIAGCAGALTALADAGNAALLQSLRLTEKRHSRHRMVG